MKSFIEFIKEDRVPRSISNFTVKERDLVDDIFLKYADDYNMMEMPVVEDEEGKYNEFTLSHRDTIQYSVTRIMNIGIDIQWVEDEISDEIITKLITELKTDFKKRLNHFGFELFFINRYPERILFGHNLVDCRTISMTITKK